MVGDSLTEEELDASEAYAELAAEREELAASVDVPEELLVAPDA